MKKVFQCAALSFLIVLGILFAAYYGNVYANDTKETVYLCFSILSVLEATMTASALIFFLKAKKGAWIRTVYVLSGVLCIPVLLFAVILIVHWLGFDLLPPLQR